MGENRVSSISEKSATGIDNINSSALLFKVLAFIMTGSWGRVAAAVVLGLVSGAGTAAIVASLNMVIVGQFVDLDVLGLRFLISLAALVVGGFLSSYILIDISQKTSMKLRIYLSEKISLLSFADIEKRGSAKLLSALSGDVQSLSKVISIIPGLVISSAMVVGCLIYLAILSLEYFAIVIFGVGAGLWMHGFFARRAKPFLHKVRDSRDSLFSFYRTLTIGSKELQLNREHLQKFLADDIGVAALEIRTQNAAAAKKYVLATVSMQIAFFSIIGVIAFILGPKTEPVVRSGYILTTLFLVGPINHLLTMVDTWAGANVAVVKLYKLGLLNQASDDGGGSRNFSQEVINFDEIRFDGVVYDHYIDYSSEPEFRVGPIDLSFRQNEIVFITGGNGSGKSTLLKLLTGLYSPSSGTIKLDGQPLLANKVDAYRQNFSAVFFDFHIFRRLFNTSVDSDKELLKLWMQKLDLSESVLREIAWEGQLPLSQGQQRRLALIAALLSDKKYFVFDEWAADQDKYYRDFFYKDLIHDLKRQGKGVIVVSHDESYYAMADKIIRLDMGLVESESETKGELVAEC